MSPRPQPKRAPRIRAVDSDADQRLLEEIGYLLTDLDDLDASDVEPYVTGGVVTLTGSVSTKTALRRLSEIVEEASGQAAINQLSIKR